MNTLGSGTRPKFVAVTSAWRLLVVTVAKVTFRSTCWLNLLPGVKWTGEPVLFQSKETSSTKPRSSFSPPVPALV
jgi:hypothetical protein